MSIIKKLVAINMLCLAFAGCGNNGIYEAFEAESNIGQQMGADAETEASAEKLESKQAAEESGAEKEYVYDAGYTELIHGGFSICFQELMETIYSRVNYGKAGINVEDVTSMDEEVIVQVEKMMKELSTVQDGEILEIVKAARILFDKTNAIVNEKKYEQLGNLDEEGQMLYNRYYEWLIEAAAHHDHEH